MPYKEIGDSSAEVERRIVRSWFSLPWRLLADYLWKTLHGKNRWFETGQKNGAFKRRARDTFEEAQKMLWRVKTRSPALPDVGPRRVLMSSLHLRQFLGRSWEATPGADLSLRDPQPIRQIS